jgi:hypothetical protein
MIAMRSGTIVCVCRVATKKMAPTRANMLAKLMLASTFSRLRRTNVVRVEAQSNQNLHDPEVVRRRVENAIQRRGPVSAAEVYQMFQEGSAKQDISESRT